MTQVDGVETCEQFDFGPFNVHQFSLDLDTLKIGRDHPQRRLGALRQRRARRRRLVLHQGSGRLSRQPRLPRRAARPLYDGRSDETSGNVVVAGGRGRVLGVAVRQLRPRPRSAQQGHGRDRGRDPHGAQPAGSPHRAGARQGVVTLGDGNVLRGAVEVADQDVETDAFASRTRRRARHHLGRHDAAPPRLGRSARSPAGRTQWSWSAYAQDSDTDQVVDELRVAGPGPRSIAAARSTTSRTATAAPRRAASSLLPRGHDVLFDVRRQLQAPHVRHAPRSPRPQRAAPAPSSRRPA